jgi:hypothetical protein
VRRLSEMQIKHLHMAEWWVYHPGELPVEDAEFLTLNGSAECHRQAPIREFSSGATQCGGRERSRAPGGAHEAEVSDTCGRNHRSTDL